MTHLFEGWASIHASLETAERVLLMLDFDGTLAPIVARPSAARVSAGTARTLHALRDRKRIELAVISGRGASDVSSLVGLTGIHYFGSHGRERMRPGCTEIETDPRGRTAIAAACRILARELAGIGGFHIENKGVAAAAHYRNVDRRHHGAVRRSVREAVRTVGDLHASPGKMVYDITPLDGVDKGLAATRLVGEIGGLPFYFGDDTTDESAFRALPPSAVTVFVGPCGAKSAARFWVTDPEEVGCALARVLRATRD